MISYLLFPSDALISIKPAHIPDVDILSLATCIHPKMQLISYMTAVARLMAPPHNGLDTP